MSPDQLVTQNLERWKEHLLDTSKRNRLLYFQPNTAVQLVEPDLKTLWDRLVSRPKIQTFFGQEETPVDLFAETESDEDEFAPSTRALKGDEIRPSPVGVKLNRLLYSLRSKSNLSLEEQGLTTLYVAWGFLKWQDAKTGDEIVSPLVLAPMTLLRESARANYRLKLYEEDLWLNPVLQWKLSSDFKIELPALPAFEDADPFTYFDEVRAAIKKEPRWSVWEAAYLGLFSFHKMAMYQDLREGESLAQRNPFVRALGGDPTQLPPVPGSLPRSNALDALPVRESFSVLDCDSSQNESVLAAQAGVSFVLQGPPGTGKSQTITNIIAHCIAQGKRVLFVSEKMAALDVVHARLEKVGLGLFCLKAHSQSATKKEVIADLGKTLAAARTGAQVHASQTALRQDEARNSEIERLRTGLNLYVQELHQPRSPLGISVYQAVGEAARYCGAAEIAVPLPNPFAIDNETAGRWRELLESACSSDTVWRQGDEHPWFGAKSRPFSLDLLATVRMRGARSQTLCQELLRDALDLAHRCGVEARELSLSQAEELPKLAALLKELGESQIKHPPAMWFVLNDLEEHLATAGRFKARYEAVAARRRALDERYQVEFWNLNHEELIERATSRHKATLDRGGTWEQFPTWAPELIERLERASMHLENAARMSQSLAAELGHDSPQTLSEFGHFANALNVLQREFQGRETRVASHWFDASQLPSLKAASEEATGWARVRDETASRLSSYDLDAMGSADLEALRTRFEQDYGSFLRVFKGQYRRESKQLASWRKDGAKVPYQSALTDLQVASRWQASEKWFQSQASSLATRFGNAFSGRATSWSSIEDALGRCDRVVAAFAPLSGLSQTLIQKLVRGDDLGAPLALLPALCDSLSALQEDLPWLQAIFSLRDLPFERNGISLALAQAPSLSVAPWFGEQAAALRDVENAFAAWTTLQKVLDNAPGALVAHGREALEVLRLEAELEGESEGLRARFDWLFEGASTNWNAIVDSLSWTNRALEWWKNWAALGGETGEAGQASGAFVVLASGESTWVAGKDELPQTRELRDEWDYFSALFDIPVCPGDSLATDAEWFGVRATRSSELEPWLRWREVSRDLQNAGLWEFWEAARRSHLEGRELMDAFERRFWSLWLDRALEQSPVLSEFDGKRHTTALERFASLDEASLGAAQRRLSQILWEKKPISTMGSAKTGEIATLQYEANKKARQKALRRLFREIPHLLGALKPCLLMSPLSVAQFLEAGRAEFDLVIFDEASQICPEDAVGAILRSKQIVVVGDRRQLPPTRFFASGGIFDSDEDEENADDSALFESILDMCAPHLPGYMLLWHYRSRSEALISFSNRHFYDGRLITFPGPHQGGVDGRGVRLESVRGTYYRGKGRDARTNPIEAERVADLVIQHFERSPQQSLGVIALNATQARAIDEAVARRLVQRPELEELASPTRRERFFIKALENVQGDERDVIFLSIGFGPDQDGKISMNFGPLNKEGGERRLNVAVTRARDALTVVSSLQSEQIDTARTSALGPRLLKSYLEMARRGGDFVDPGHDFDTEGLVDAVDTALQARGWKTQRGIGQSALKIDIAIEHPHRAGEFLMGIECDGGDYRAAPTARDRERLRPSVLRGLGWNLERVWALDWLKNPERELARLEARLRELLEDSTPHQSEQQAALTGEMLPAEVDVSEVHEASFTFAEEVSVQEPAPMAQYEAVELGHRGWPDDFSNSRELRDAIWQVVSAESPIRVEFLQQKVARAWNIKRVGSSIADTVYAALQREPRVQTRGNFVWKVGQSHVAFRVPPPGESPRPIEYISPEEIGDAVLHCVRNAFGLERTELVRQTARVLGFSRTGVQVELAITTAIDSLLLNGKLVERSGAIGLGA